MFEAADEEKNGSLTSEHILDILGSNMGMNERYQYETILRKIDSDQNGRIDYSEFLNLTISHENLLSNKNLEITFKNLDIDQDKSVSLAELQKAFEAGGNKKT